MKHAADNAHELLVDDSVVRALHPVGAEIAPHPAAAGRRQPSGVIWLTGRSGAGKTTIALELELELERRGLTVGRLDGDDLRTGLCSDLGFSEWDRCENVRRAAEAAHLMTRAGVIVIVSLISPFRSARAAARALFAADEFFEVHIDTPLEVAEQRDPKGLYRRARNGQIMQFTGIDSPYEPPESPELRLETVATTPSDCALAILDAMDRRDAASG
ncbi:MAG TPA: adenylyl-sulfate kinase [Solirubrobacteraceae bacterium]|nr:adenylyl-sulfate kinase [Solirubrobacteraceae bacterium]